MSDFQVIADRVEIDTASGRAYIQELGRAHDGRSELNYAIYHDQRPPAGSAPRAAAPPS